MRVNVNGFLSIYATTPRLTAHISPPSRIAGWLLGFIEILGIHGGTATP
ncbi:MAG: hypothetical protein VB140_06975 [Burkholderia sp.]